MTHRSKRQSHDLAALRLPELQARFREVTGETSRSPNRTFLIRRIEEALAARADPAAAPSASREATTARPSARRRNESAPARSAPRDDTSAHPPQRGRFASMTIEELQTKYLEVVGRPTGSDNRRYIAWKVREAEKGRINVGPRKTRARDGEPLDVKIVPLRLDTEVADKMDAAWRARGIKSRMEFFRGAIGHYLAHLGARDAAALFTDAGA